MERESRRKTPAHRAASVAGTLVPIAGLAWLAAAVATGQRYPGASRAWVLPAALGFVVAGSLLALVAIGAARMRAPSPLAVAERAARPLWLAWVFVALLLASSQANHYFANWPRLRVAALAATLAIAALAAEIAGLRLLERRYGMLSRLVRRCGAPVLVFAGCLSVFVASAGGHLYTPDEWTIYAAAAGLVNHGVPAAFADEPYPLHHLALARTRAAPEGEGGGTDGGVAARSTRMAGPRRAYTKYGILPSLLAAPLYAVARLTGPGPHLPPQAFPYENQALPLVPLLLNPLVTAGTAAVLFVTARDLGYRRQSALVAAGAFAFGSLAWPYAKTLMNMTLAGGCLLVAFWCATRATRTTDDRRRTTDDRRRTTDDRPPTTDRRWQAPCGCATPAGGSPAPASRPAWPSPHGMRRRSSPCRWRRCAPGRAGGLARRS